MAEFRKKPVVVEAWCNTADLPHRDLTPDWLAQAMKDGTVWFSGGPWPSFTIKTLEGEMRADYGDWIIRGVKGELYPCKPDIFAATYEGVAQGDTLGAPEGQASLPPISPSHYRALAEFAKEMVERARIYSAVDGGDVRSAAERLGLLVEDIYGENMHVLADWLTREEQPQ